ncbi:unnamed protein product [Victoria cruziana]
MFLLYEYDILWAFFMISSVIPILAFIIFRVLAPISEGPEKLSSYESGIEPIGDAWIQFRICYYMFALVFYVKKALIFMLIPVVGSVYAWQKGALEWS